MVQWLRMYIQALEPVCVQLPATTHWPNYLSSISLTFIISKLRKMHAAQCLLRSKDLRNVVFTIIIIIRPIHADVPGIHQIQKCPRLNSLFPPSKWFISVSSTVLNKAIILPICGPQGILLLFFLLPHFPLTFRGHILLYLYSDSLIHLHTSPLTWPEFRSLPLRWLQLPCK